MQSSSEYFSIGHGSNQPLNFLSKKEEELFFKTDREKKPLKEEAKKSFIDKFFTIEGKQDAEMIMNFIKSRDFNINWQLSIPMLNKLLEKGLTEEQVKALDIWVKTETNVSNIVPAIKIISDKEKAVS